MPTGNRSCCVAPLCLISQLLSKNSEGFALLILEPGKCSGRVSAQDHTEVAEPGFEPGSAILGPVLFLLLSLCKVVCCTAEPWLYCVLTPGLWKDPVQRFRGCFFGKTLEPTQISPGCLICRWLAHPVLQPRMMAGAGYAVMGGNDCWCFCCFLGWGEGSLPVPLTWSHLLRVGF